MNTRRFVAFVLLLLLAGSFSAWRISKSWSFTLIGSLVNRVETSQPLVALTFDDGPTPGATDKILETLATYSAKATFFIIGQELEQNMTQGKKIVEAGHELGNHSYSHKRMVLKTPSFVREEISKTDDLIRQAGHQGPIHFRPPYAAKLLVLPYILKDMGRLNIFMDLAPDSLADIEHDRDKMTKYVVDNARPGSIILMHVMYGSRQASMDAVPDILRLLSEKGFRLVTVSELLSTGDPVEADVVQ
jgi:peptidoglycan-N-acetylglucosamine deacetylase